MRYDLSDRLADGADIVVANGLAARQLDAFLMQDRLPSLGSATAGSALTAFDPWLQGLWRRQSPAERNVLTTSQTQALWRKIIADSPEADELIGVDSAASWANDAWQRLWAYELDPHRLAARDGDSEFAAFLRWANQFRDVLDRNGWTDSSLILDELLRTPDLRARSAPPIIWADLGDLTPARRSLYARLQRADREISTWEPHEPEPRGRRVGLTDAREELAAAAEWASGSLAQNHRQRLAIVVSRTEPRRHDVARILSRALDTGSASLTSRAAPQYFEPRGAPATDDPAVGAALNALELLSPRGRFVHLSRWLRSPFFVSDPDDDLDRAAIERDLRLKPLSQLGFRDAFENRGLASCLREGLPGSERRLRRALERLVSDREIQRVTPTRWARIWQEALSELGWPGDQSDVESRSLPVWDTALNDFCLLTPIVGTLSMSEALAEFERTVAEPRAAGPVPIFGLTILERVEDVAAGYDAVWVTGMTDTEWPRPATPNPLLPLQLQADHDMPGCAPRETLLRCQRITESLRQRTPNLIVSWPETVFESAASPSPLIAEFPTADFTAGTDALRRGKTPPREQLIDPAPPLSGRDIRGGAQTLTLQARSPLRAFVQTRLGARPLETMHRGLSARLRGIVTHRAFELFLRRLPSKDELDAWEEGARAEFAEACVNRALMESFNVAAEHLRVVIDLERDRLLTLIGSLHEKDRARTGFDVTAVEEKRSIEISGYRLACRIDRVDSLDTGGLAVIDYKTGKSASPTDWLDDRLRDVQLPLYAQASNAEVTATVIANVTLDGVNFKGIWSPKETFPGRPRALPEDREWNEQLAVWTQQLESLVAEYVSGDVRILLSDEREVAGSYTPLSRLPEQKALLDGGLEPWTST
jgi:probable DNA repair protein